MAVIETKYDIGDVVWHASINTERRSHPCPDCLGSKVWKAESPAGGVFEAPCPRCTEVYMSNRDLSLDYAQWTPFVRKLTIGLVQPNGHAYSDGPPQNQYMCHETGIGSGSIYRESVLFATEEEARAHGDLEATIHNSDADGWVAKQFSGSAKWSDYQLKDAAMKAAESRASEVAYAAAYLLEDLDEAESLDEVKRIIASWREKRDAA